jgi:meiotically up-regulated gene 157 (Mug157) protein
MPSRSLFQLRDRRQRRQQHHYRREKRKSRLVPCFFGGIIIGLVLTIAGHFILCFFFLSSSTLSPAGIMPHPPSSFLRFRRRQNHNRKHPSAPISYGRLPLTSNKTTFNLPAYPINHRYRQEIPVALSNHAISACNHALWRTLETTTLVLPNNETFVFTGDIYDLWLRDSAAQIHTLLLPRTFLLVNNNGNYHNNNHNNLDNAPNKEDYGSLVQSDPRLERIVSGLILKTARYIRYDPYANAFRLNPTQFNTFERDVLGRFGFISTWNYELDSGCYFVRMLYYFHYSFPSHSILREKEVKEAVMIMIDVWIAEQRHEDDDFPEGILFDCYHCAYDLPYRYNPDELSRDGKGSPTNSSAGLVWSAFRPSDDPCEYGYLIPANMFVVVVLGYVMELCDTIWNDNDLKKRANKLREEIHYGIQQHGVVEHPKYGKIYAYEVDGLGNYLLMDDANVPNLLSIPYIGYDYDEEVYANTKKFILSVDNPTFHRGGFNHVKIEGLGSPHTMEGWGSPNAKKIANGIWPMGMIMEGLVSDDINEKIDIVEKLLQSSAGKNQMHEAFNADNPSEYSREWFCWADSLFAELVMSLSDGCPEIYGTYPYMMDKLFANEN